MEVVLLADHRVLLVPPQSSDQGIVLGVEPQAGEEFDRLVVDPGDFCAG
jgi:hypothetical protein